ncbi:YaiI/YqxD family protein [Acuticoccus sp. MNP-M23]|uniref:YaiI/YqxD family protein n=1 Tax=Acuticoccus sp. MNP-M23 TaxID=3072793 RepID=UPI002814E66E|nr:YaiI/YqxD family protein [Acuticoccus sp. MNP-M23]WMS44320.1 YaiI/YqxD family protein [Acuticoccus sp. MNP-M23]
MTIYIDADACPVKDETIKVAERYSVPVVIVSNGGIRPRREPLVETVVVPEGPDAADMWIAERAGPGDICITGDIPLAARCLEGGAAALRHNGDPFTKANIGEQMAMRDLMADLRAADPFRQGRGKPFSRADRSKFLQALDRMVQSAQKG